MKYLLYDGVYEFLQKNTLNGINYDENSLMNILLNTTYIDKTLPIEFNHKK